MAHALFAAHARVGDAGAARHVGRCDAAVTALAAAVHARLPERARAVAETAAAIGRAAGRVGGAARHALAATRVGVALGAALVARAQAEAAASIGRAAGRIDRASRDAGAHATDAAVGRGARGIAAARRDAETVVTDLSARTADACAGVHQARARTTELPFGARHALTRRARRAREVTRAAVAARRIAGRDVGAAATRGIAELPVGAAHALARHGQAAGEARAIDARLFLAAHDARARVDGRHTRRATSLVRAARVVGGARIGLTEAAEAQRLGGAVEVALAHRRSSVVHDRIGRARCIEARVATIERRRDRRCAGITAGEDDERQGDGDRGSARHVDLGVCLPDRASGSRS